MYEEEEQTDSNQKEPNSLPDVSPDFSEIPETDTSPLKTMMILHGNFLTVEIEGPEVARSRAVNVGGKSSESDDGVSVSEYWARKNSLF